MRGVTRNRPVAPATAAWLVMAGCLLTAPAPAAADLPINATVRIVNLAGVPCPSQPQLRRTLARAFDRQMRGVALHIPHRLVIELVVSRHGGGLRGDIRTSDEAGDAGRRPPLVVATTSCRTLVFDAIPVLLGPFDAYVGVRRPPVRPRGRAGERRLRRRVAAATPVPALAPPPTTVVGGAGSGSLAGLSVGPRVQLALGIGTEFGSAADPVIAATLGVELRFQYWSFGVEGRAQAPSDTSSHERTIRSTRAHGAIVPCARWRWLGACAVLAVGWQRLQGLEEGHDETTAFFAGGGRLEVEIGLLAWLAARVSVEVVAPTSRRRWVVIVDDAPVVVHTPWPVSVSLGVVAVGRF